MAKEGMLERYNSSPRQNHAWMESMKSLGITNLHLEGPGACQFVQRGLFLCRGL